MSRIVEFIKAHNNTKSKIACNLVESIGPAGYESFCLFSTTGTTAPHIDLFPTTVEGNCENIIISGKTAKYEIPIIQGANEQDFIEQYFLENPTRAGIQYLIRANSEDYSEINHYHYNFIIPGLVYNDMTGKVLGFLHSYITNGSTVEFEIPFGSTDTYSFTNATATKKSGEDYIYLLSINGDSATVRVTAGDATAEFHLYKNSGTVNNTYTIKNMNEYVDYAIASQIKTNIVDLKDYFEEMEQVPLFLNAWHPAHFKSSYLWSFAETAKNITPNIYKVPAAFVANGNRKVFMTNVTGISTNEII